MIYWDSSVNISLLGSWAGTIFFYVTITFESRGASKIHLQSRVSGYWRCAKLLWHSEISVPRSYRAAILDVRTKYNVRSVIHAEQ